MRTIGLLFFALGSFLSHLLRHVFQPIAKAASFVNYMFTRYYTGKFDEPAMKAFSASSSLLSINIGGFAHIFAKIFGWPVWLVEATKFGGGAILKKLWFILVWQWPSIISSSFLGAGTNKPFKRFGIQRGMGATEFTSPCISWPL